MKKHYLPDHHRMDLKMIKMMKIKRVFILITCLCFLSLVISSCKDDKDDAPVFTSAEGKWTYTTPDSKIKIDFEVVKSATGLIQINGTALTVDTKTVVPEVQTDGINLPAIASMRFNANDAGLVYPYSITFTQTTVSADFTTMTATTAEYTFPWGTTQKLSALIIKRP
jgi:hypothetical protein